MTDSPSPALWKLAETADKVRLLQEIDRLSGQVDYWRKKAQSLERELHKEVRTARERPFGNDTPSSRQLFRPDAPEAKVARKGGAKPGHDGHGRHCAGEDEADEVVELAKPPACDRCGGELEDFKVEERSVRVAVSAHYRNLHYVIRTGWCAKCSRQVKERVPGVLPRFAASNGLLAQNVMDRYVYGMTVGTISARTGLSKSAILSEDERLSEILKPCTDRLLELYRASPVKGADETTWSCDGQRGYVYGFFTDDVALFRFRGTRRKFVAEDVFGPDEHHFGVLVRDRYSAYDNSFRGKQQYCFEHLKRDCLELLEKEPENREYRRFVPKFVDLLREAMKLRSRDIPDDKYYAEARRIKAAMLKMIDAQARDAGLQKYQDIYRRHPDRIFQWVEDRRVPAENNMSERGVRRTVIARKTCGGSQSEDALMVREVLQSVIGSLRLRCDNPVARLTEALDAYALDKTFRIEDFLFPLQKA